MSSDNTGLFEQVESVDDSALVDIPTDKRKPTIGSTEWTDYVLSLLSDKECVTIKDKKIPRMDGLRRICNLVLGRVYRSESHVVDPPNQNNSFTSTVHHTLHIKQVEDQDDLVVTGAADASREFLTHPFNQYVVANASTKAMSRAYRDALQLQVLVAEELNSMNDITASDEPEDVGPIDSAQKAAIVAVCKKLQIDVNKLINMGPFKHKNLDHVLKGTARRIMSLLNSYQSNSSIPDDIRL